MSTLREPAVSRNGRLVAFSGTTNRNASSVGGQFHYGVWATGLYLARWPTSAAATACSPAWSSDGTRLAAIDRPGGETTELWTFAADGIGRTVRRKLKAGTSTVRIAGVSRGRHRVTARTPGELVRRVSARSR